MRLTSDFYDNCSWGVLFRMGSNAGFFFEYNGMLCVMLYCMRARQKFLLHSTNSNISEYGWTRFFKPFCREYDIGGFEYENRFVGVADYESRRANKITYTTSDIFNDVHWWCKRQIEKNVIFDFPEFYFKGTVYEFMRDATSIIWKYNERTNCDINDAIRGLNLPEHYAAAHVRRGDKTIETDLIPVRDYVVAIERTDCDVVYVLTDDADVMNEFKKIDSSRNYVTLDTPAVQCGFCEYEYDKFPSDFRERMVLQLLIDVEIAKNADIIIGGYNSNVDAFLAYYAGMNKFVNLYFAESHWTI